MAIDETGTKPGLPSKAEESKPVHMRCKREGCSSILAVEIKVAGMEGRHLYRCVKCNDTQGVVTGGTFNYF